MLPVLTYRRPLILQALRDRLATVTIANGFATDAGLYKVWIGEDVDLAETDPDAVFHISAPLEEFLPGHAKHYGEWPLSIRAIAKAKLEDPILTAELMIGDVQRAIEQQDRTLGGLVDWNGDHGLILRSIGEIERQPGSATVGMEVVYIAKTQRSWGDPS